VLFSEEKRSMEDLAIEVRAGYKSFGRDSRRVHVMKNFNMSVPRGNIYGLLGKHDKVVMVQELRQGIQEGPRREVLQHERTTWQHLRPAR
jgi:ABC-type glutathione transport system ATPase component